MENLLKLDDTLKALGIEEFDACEALSALSSCVSQAPAPGQGQLGVDLSALSPEERELLLEYWQAAELSKKHKRELPSENASRWS